MQHCWYCGVVLTTEPEPLRGSAAALDHRDPWAAARGHREDPVVLACTRCHLAKGHLSVEAYRHRLMRLHAPTARAYACLATALCEVQTPYDDALLQAMQWLEAHTPRHVFWGESHEAPSDA
jgi:hypothetical protein